MGLAECEDKMRSRSAITPAIGLTLAVALHVIAGWGAATGSAQPVSNTTTTVSSTSSTSFESPPACTSVGASRQVQTVTFTVTGGPACIGIGNRDIANPAPACAGFQPAAPPVHPAFGTVYLVPPGSVNSNANTHTETIGCVAAVPALPVPLFVGLGGALAGLGLWRMRLSGRLWSRRS